MVVTTPSSATVSLAVSDAPSGNLQWLMLKIFRRFQVLPISVHYRQTVWHKHTVRVADLRLRLTVPLLGFGVVQVNRDNDAVHYLPMGISSRPCSSNCRRRRHRLTNAKYVTKLDAYCAEGFRAIGCTEELTFAKTCDAICHRRWSAIYGRIRPDANRPWSCRQVYVTLQSGRIVLTKMSHKSECSIWKLRTHATLKLLLIISGASSFWVA